VPCYFLALVWFRKSEVHKPPPRVTPPLIKPKPPPPLPRVPFLPRNNRYWAYQTNRGSARFVTGQSQNTHSTYFPPTFRSLATPAKVSCAVQQWAPLVSDQLTKWIANGTPTRRMPRAITLVPSPPPKSGTRTRSRRRNARERAIIAESPLRTSSHPTSSRMRLPPASTRNGNARNLPSFPRRLPLLPPPRPPNAALRRRQSAVIPP